MKLKFSIGKLTVSYSVSVYFSLKRKVTVQGTTNRTMDGKFVPYLDYDMTPLNNVLAECLFLQEYFVLGDLHVFKSSELSYHVVGFDKLNTREFLELLEQSTCDINFKNVPRTFSIRSWVLRWSEKRDKDRPKYLKTLKSNHKQRQSSTAHYEFFRHLYPDAKIKKPTNSDGIRELEHITYETRG